MPVFSKVSFQGNRYKSKNNQRDLIKLTSFCITKETINEMKRQPSEWEKVFANKATEKGFISKIFKRAHTAQYQKDKQPNQKMGRRPT